MLNSYAKAYSNVNINSISGTLIKSHPNSFNVLFHPNSTMAERLFTSKPIMIVGTRCQDVVVLQVMLTGIDARGMIAEVVLLSDYLESEGE